MAFKDPEKKKEYMRKYRKNNTEKIREKRREYNKKNKEKKKKYNEDNKERIRQQTREYSKTDKGIKIHLISTWKRRGLVDDYEKVYERYEYTLFCDLCRCDLDQCNKSKKCMDHNHQTGLFRNVLCNVCNIKRG